MLGLIELAGLYPCAIFFSTRRLGISLSNLQAYDLIDQRGGMYMAEWQIEPGYVL